MTRSPAFAATIPQRHIANHPPFDSRVRELQIEHILLVLQFAENAKTRAAAFGAFYRSVAFDVLIDFEPPFAISQPASSALPHGPTGPNIYSFSLIVRVSALVDLGKFWAEKRLFAEAQTICLE